MISNKKKHITSLSIGGFDGMHLAHKQIFNKLDVSSSLIIIQTKYQNLTPKKDRQNHTNCRCFYYNLDDIRHLDGLVFVQKILKKFKNLKTIVVGFDFAFGKDAKYNAYDLDKCFGGNIIIIDEFKLNNIPVHSRDIRKHLLDGNILQANKMLGRNYHLKGKVVKGLGLGKKEFVPTINIYCKKFLIPKHGVWITKSEIKNANKYGYKNKAYCSITFIGHKTSINGDFAIETHILNLSMHTHKHSPKELKISFLEFVRENNKFNSYAELKNQINYDIKKAEKYFKLSPLNS